MGSWGYNPNDSDAAQDLLETNVWDPVQRKLVRMFTVKRIDSYEKWHRIGAAFELLDLRNSGAVSSRRPQLVPDLVLEIGSDWCDELLQDDEWVSSWKDPNAIKRSVRRVRKRFDDVLADRHKIGGFPI
jgi:hypothetical protein